MNTSEVNAPRAVVVMNCGSSSVKLDVLVFPEGACTLRARVERVGRPGTRLAMQREGPAAEARMLGGAAVGASMATAVHAVLEEVERAGIQPAAVGHRVVHGGARFHESTRIDDEVLEAIRACVPLAPLHNPANLEGIEAARLRLPQVPQVAVFDTAFHQTMEPEAFLYALPRALHRDEGVRRYGFHGTSHRYVAEEAAHLLGRPLASLRMVTLHLGNGCSACAIDAGRSVETSMGMTPLEGLVMGTRSGDVDPAVVLRLARARGVDGAEQLLNAESGLLGLSGRSQDMRDLERAAAEGDADAELAIRAFVHRARKAVGAYAVTLGALDALVFTGGIGENSARVRRDVCRGLEVLGVHIDEALNTEPSHAARDIAPPGAASRLLVIPTNEELAIARDALRLVGGPA